MVPISSVSATPQIDGQISTNEWDEAEMHAIELNTGIVVNLSILYTNTMVYYLAVIEHSKEVNEINLDPSKPHDYFGIEFDNNGDNAIMGTAVSPDDTIIVNYEQNIGADMYMHTFKAFYDNEHGGTDDVTGKAGTDGKNLYFEIAKPLSSGDTNGYDFELVPGSSYQIMIAFWDDQPPRSANGGVNKRIDNNQFLTLYVDTVIDTTSSELISISVISISIVMASIFAKYGRLEIVRKIKQKLAKLDI